MIENLLNHLGAGPKLAFIMDFKMEVIQLLKLPAIQLLKLPAIQLQIVFNWFSVEKRMVLTVEKRSLRTVSEPS